MGVAHAAGRDAGKMRQIRRDIERDPVEAHPLPQAHADGGDLVFRHFAAPSFGLLRPLDPDADAPGAPLARDAEIGERRDDP